MRRIVLFFVAFLLIFAALPFGAFAEETTETKVLSPLAQEVITEARETFVKAQRFAGKRSFHGKCGLFVATQLRVLGINTKRVSFNGNDSYDYYADLESTTGGYYVMSYSGIEYDLLSALQEVSDYGKKDVRNILVGFQWTNTRAGSKYGHVMLINGIIDGTVYFVESFDSALGGKEGTVLQCSMEEFAASYNKWTRFDGLVHFGNKNYYDVCVSKNTDLTLQARFPASLRSQPSLVGKKDCEMIGNISAGETYHATGIYNDGRSWYYRVETKDGFGFVSCNAMGVVEVGKEGITLSDAKFSGSMKQGKKPAFTGSVTDTSGMIQALEVCITDEAGQLVRREVADIYKPEAALSQVGNMLWLDLLEDGSYQVQIFAVRACPAVSGGAEGDYHIRFLLKSYTLEVGT